MEYWRQLLYLSKSLFAQKIDRLQIFKGVFRIHSCCFWQQRSSPTVHQTHFNLPAFHTQLHYLYSRFNIVYLKKDYIFAIVNKPAF